MSARSPSAPTASRTVALDDLRQEFTHVLAAERRLRGRDQQRTHGELSQAHVRALFALGLHDEEATAGQIARSAEMSPASVTGMLDDLEQAGIVTRRRSETDRRCVLVALTDEGRDVLEAKRARWRERWNEALGAVPERDLRAAVRVMRTIAGVLDGV